MMFVLELMTMLVTTLLLGFVLGRIWEIRQQQIQLAEHRDKRQLPVELSMASERVEQTQATDRKPSQRSDNEVRRGRSGYTSRFHAPHRSLHHVGGGGSL